MKKILITAAVGAALALTGCSGHSEASREHLDAARQQATEMFHAAAAAADSAAARP